MKTNLKMTDSLKVVATGAAGVAGIEASDVILDTVNSGVFNQILDTIISVLIGVATLWGLIKRNKKK